MSPVHNDELRYPLSPVQEPNLLSDAPPPLELPDTLKGENMEGDDARLRTVSRSQMTPVAVDDAGSVQPDAPPVNLNVITPIQVPPEVCVTKGPDTVDTTVVDSDDDRGGWEQTSPPGELSRRMSDGSVGALVCGDASKDSDESDEDAVMALLSLQRVNSVSDISPPASVSGKRPRSESPVYSSSRHSPVPKHIDGESRFFCRYPSCGKGYASTDAVRKHCRQRHLEWLRRLGHGCPALYCRWGEQA